MPKSLRHRYGLRSAHSTAPHGEFYIECCAAICYDIHMKAPRQAFDKSLEAVHIFREALQGWLFPSLEAELGALDDKHRAFVDLCAALHEHFPAAQYEWCGNGKPPESRWSYFKALLAKAFWNFPPSATWA